MRPGLPRLGVLLLIYAAFVSIGLPDGILGAAWPQMRAQFAVELDQNWPMLLLATGGGALSSFLSGVALRRLGVGRVLILSTFLTAFVIIGYSLSAAFAVIIALSFFLGLGNGAVDAGLNHFVASNLASRHMNWLHAFWGVGMSLGSLSVSGALAAGGSWRTAYLVIGVLQLGLAVAFSIALRSPPRPAPEVAQERRCEQPVLLATLALPATWTRMALFFVYCGLEAGAGLWIASLLHDGRGWTMQAAGLMVTLYWGSLTVGRFLIGLVSDRMAPMRLVRVAVVGAVVGTSLVALSSAVTERAVAAGLLTALGLPLTGLSLSPIFPMLMHDTPRAVGRGHALNLIGFQAGSAQLGYTTLPIAIGTLLRRGSTEWLGLLLVWLALTMLALALVRARGERGPGPVPA